MTNTVSIQSHMPSDPQPGIERFGFCGCDAGSARGWGWLAEQVEDLAAMYRRVARVVAGIEPDLDDDVELTNICRSYEHLMSCGDFLPNSPTLVNAGKPQGVLSGCFVLPIEDSGDQQPGSTALMTQLHHWGAGTGFSLSGLSSSRGERTYADEVRHAVHSLDDATRATATGSPRCGANMALLRVDHPAIREFIALKRQDEGSLSTFNLSVGVSDRFMQSVQQGRRFALQDPVTRQIVGRVWAMDLLDEIAQAAWACGDPGLVFLDAVERANPLPSLGRLEAMNPCGETPLLAYESCNLGSINLGNMTRGDVSGQVEIDWIRLARAVRLAVRFLDDVIDAAGWPDPRLAAAAKRSRKIGLGVMGFADLLVRLRMPYDSDMAEQTAGQLMSFINHTAHSASEVLADQRGVFPAWNQSVYADRAPHLRNAACTAIAPTGTISRVVGVNPGIEPFFLLADGSRAQDGSPRWLCPALRRFALDTKRDLEPLLTHLSEHGTLADAPGLHAYERRLFKTAIEIPAEQQLRIQAAFQQYTDQGVAKTINLPPHALFEEVKAAFIEAWQMDLKGVTVFRWGCRGTQPFGSTKHKGTRS